MPDNRHAQEWPAGRNHGWKLADIHRTTNQKRLMRAWRKGNRRRLHIELAGERKGE